MNQNQTDNGILGPRAFRRMIALGFMAALTFFFQEAAFAESAQEIASPKGCSLAHCHQALSDHMQLQPPLSARVVEAWRDRSVFGSYLGMGCVANTHTVVCAFRSTPTYPTELKAYSPR